MVRYVPARRHIRGTKELGLTIPQAVLVCADEVIRRGTGESPDALASGTGPGEPARGRFSLFQIHHRRLSVRRVPYHSVERVAGMNQRDPCSKLVVEDHAICPSGDSTRTRAMIPPLERVARIDADLEQDVRVPSR